MKITPHTTDNGGFSFSRRGATFIKDDDFYIFHDNSKKQKRWESRHNLCCIPNCSSCYPNREKRSFASCPKSERPPINLIDIRRQPEVTALFGENYIGSWVYDRVGWSALVEEAGRRTPGEAAACGLISLILGLLFGIFVLPVVLIILLIVFIARNSSKR